MPVRKYFPGSVVNGWHLHEPTGEYSGRLEVWSGQCVVCGARRQRTVTNFRAYRCRHKRRPAFGGSVSRKLRYRKWRHDRLVTLYKDFGTLYTDSYYIRLPIILHSELAKRLGHVRLDEPFKSWELATDPTWNANPRSGGVWPDDEDEPDDEEEEAPAADADDLPLGEPLPVEPKDEYGFTSDENIQISFARHFDKLAADHRARGAPIEHFVERAVAAGLPRHIAWRRLGVLVPAPVVEDDESRHDMLETEDRLYRAVRRKLQEPLPFGGKYASRRGWPQNVSPEVAIRRYVKTTQAIVRRKWLQRYVAGDTTLDELPVSALGSLPHSLAHELHNRKMHSVGELVRQYQAGASLPQRVVDLLEEYDLLEPPEASAPTGVEVEGASRTA